MAAVQEAAVLGEEGSRAAGEEDLMCSSWCHKGGKYVASVIPFPIVVAMQTSLIHHDMLSCRTQKSLRIL